MVCGRTVNPCESDSNSEDGAYSLMPRCSNGKILDSKSMKWRFESVAGCQGRVSRIGIAAAVLKAEGSEMGV
jgi:hypothetical protein